MYEIDESGEQDARELRRVGISHEQMERIARIAARKVLQEVYAEFGRSIVRKMIWLAVIAVLSLTVWLAGKDALVRP